MSLSAWEHSCPNYEMRFAPEAGLMWVSWDSLFGNLFRACPSPFGRGWREAPEVPHVGGILRQVRVVGLAADIAHLEHHQQLPWFESLAGQACHPGTHF